MRKNHDRSQVERLNRKIVDIKARFDKHLTLNNNKTKAANGNTNKKSFEINKRPNWTAQNKGK